MSNGKGLTRLTGKRINGTTAPKDMAQPEYTVIISPADGSTVKGNHYSAYVLYSKKNQEALLIYALLIGVPRVSIGVFVVTGSEAGHLSRLEIERM